MPYQIKLDGLPAGITAKSTLKGELATIVTREFTSSEDGDLFIKRLDGIPSEIINLVSTQALKAPIGYSQIDHLLAVISKDESAVVYINEIPIITDVSLKSNGKEKGELIFRDDIAEILRVRLDKIDIPDSAGIVLLFSVDWRKALFFDFSPLVNASNPRNYDLEVILGQYYSYLYFQNIFKISDVAWENLTLQRWFPFTSLKKRTIEDMISHASEGWNIDDLTAKISDELLTMLPQALDRWKSNEIFHENIPFFSKAVDKYRESDFLSALSILYPRIEGLLRKIHSSSNKTSSASQRNLAKTLVERFSENQRIHSSLLPMKFQSYLQDVFFANFDPMTSAEISRNSVSHGVAPIDKFDLKSATIAFLIVDQLYFYLFSQKNLNDK